MSQSLEMHKRAFQVRRLWGGRGRRGVGGRGEGGRGKGGRGQGDGERGRGEGGSGKGEGRRGKLNEDGTTSSAILQNLCKISNSSPYQISKANVTCT